MEASVSLSGENYNEFLRIISILKDTCNDIDIKEGIIRQRSNDNSCIFEIDVNPLLTDVSLSISDLKQKLELFKIFTDQDVEISINDEFYIITDQYSTIQIKLASHDFIDNTFMTPEELESVFTLNDDTLMLQTEIPITISERIQIIRTNFNVDTVQVTLHGEQARISSRNQSKDQNAKLMSNIITEMNMHCETDLLATPFILDHDGDMIFKMFNSQEGVAVNKFETSISDVNITVYSRSSLVEIEASEDDVPF